MTDWKMYNSQIIVDNHSYFVEQCHHVHDVFVKEFPNKDSTWGYRFYNIFGATSPSPIWYDLYKELRDMIRQYVGHDRPLWMQSWLNFHTPNTVLDWHNHYWSYHGYISIDPKNTRTVFEGYDIKNEVGNIYIGPGYRKHKVEVDEHFDQPRITLGYDIESNPKKYPHPHWSLIPLL